MSEEHNWRRQPELGQLIKGQDAYGPNQSRRKMPALLYGGKIPIERSIHCVIPHSTYSEKHIGLNFVLQLAWIR